MLPPQSPLHLLTDLPAQAAAHTQLATELKTTATWTGPGTLTSRGGNRAHEVSWIEPQNFWFTAYDAHDNRFNLGFGLEDPRANDRLQITSWINPAKRATTRSSGAFVRDADGAVYLCHTGTVGGGKKGVGKHAFLDWLDRPRVQVDGRQLVPVARLGSDTLAQDLADYVHAIKAFKDEVGEAAESEDEEPDDADDEPWSLDAILDDLDPTQRPPVLSWMAHAIEQAHTVSPASWAVTRRRGPRLRLLIGRTVAFEVRRGVVGIGLNLPTLSEPETAQSDASLDDSGYEGLDDSTFRYFTTGRFLDVPEQVRPSTEVHPVEPASPIWSRSR